MVTRSLFTGVSGLQAHFSKLDTISNNIANLNTPGFKKSDVVFKSFFSQQTQIATSPDPAANRGGTNPQSTGLGVSVGSKSLDMSQGQLQRTGKNTDLAIQGEGFFKVKEAGSGQELYTRAGSFQFDANGNLVDPANGNIVQGFTAETENGEIQDLKTSGVPEDIKVTQAMKSIPGQETTFQDIAGNLDSNAKIGVDSLSVSYTNEGSSGDIQFNFERYHPTKDLYRFTATWKSNPPSGKKIGDAVTDQITGRKLQGILQLNDEGKVTEIYRNPDTNGNNGIEQVEALRGNSSSYTINPQRIEARDQTNFFQDLENQDWNGEMRIKFGTDSGSDVVGPQQGPTAFSDDQFALQWQNVRGEWRNILQDSAPSSVDGDSVETWKGSIANGTNDMVMRDTNGDGSPDRIGEIEFKDNFVEENTASQGDTIAFSVAQADNTGLLNQTGEEVKEEFRWGGTGTERFRVSNPNASSKNNGDGVLNRVFNYNENNTGFLENSNHLNNIPNKEFNIFFSDQNTYHVAAGTQQSGTKGTQTNLSGPATATSNTLNVNNSSGYSIGDLVKVKDPASAPTVNQEVAVVTEVVDPTTIRVEKPGSGGAGLDESYSAGATVSNFGQVLVNQNGSVNFTRGADQQIWADQNVDDAPPGGDGISSTGEYTSADTDLGISIAADDWEGTPAENDEFNFTLTESRSRSSISGRPFMIAKDGENQNTAIFGPEGSPSQPSEINFAPNTDDQSGILDVNQPGFSNLRAEGGNPGATEQKDDSAVRQVASSDVFDSLGNQHTLSYKFEKQSENTWMWHVKDPAPVNTDNTEIAGFGKLKFNDQGQLVESTNFVSKVAEDLPPPGPGGDLDREQGLGIQQDPKERQVYFNPPSGTLQSDPDQPDSQNPDVGAAPVSIDPDFSNLTQFAGESSAEISDQDGVAKGRLSSLNFNNKGVLKGSYDNGETRELAQVTITKFRNPEGLKKEGGTYFKETTNSGLARPGTAGTGARGSIAPGALERSNVDLETEFTQLITTQRGFQANTRTISTTDQMLQQVLALR